MCRDCWNDAENPRIDNPNVRRAAELIDTIYAHSGVGVPFHVELVGWNLDHNSWEPYWSDDEPDPGHQAAADELAPLMRSLTVDERISAVALQEGFWRPDTNPNEEE